VRQAACDAGQHAVRYVKEDTVERLPGKLDPTCPVRRRDERSDECANGRTKDRRVEALQELRQADDRERQRHPRLQDRQLDLPGTEDYREQQKDRQQLSVDGMGSQQDLMAQDGQDEWMSQNVEPQTVRKLIELHRPSPERTSA